MPRSLRILVPLTAALALLPATGASAAKATFTGTFEAERSVQWDRPRIVTTTDCNGEHYNQAKGGETASMKSKPFKVTVQTFGRQTRLDFKSVKPLPEGYGIEAAGPHKRFSERKAGFTGGWCGGAKIFEQESDCGTKLPSYVVTFGSDPGKLTWNASHASWMGREKLNFYKCTILPPEGMYDSSFPKLEGKYRASDFFNRRKRTITIQASKSYGPSIVPITSSVNQTSTGTFRWKLVLKRSR